ncbi:MAG TPA: hypothetical protein VIY48_21575 [Candidatus Paceibacterota bacterium]
MTTVGTDPELAVVNQEGEVVPSGWLFDVWETTMDVIQPPPPIEGMPPKGRKLYLTQLGDGFVLYEDGASLEFQVPPTDLPEDMVFNLSKILVLADQMVTDAGYRMLITASLPITDEVIQRGGVALSRFGCDPDSTMMDDPYDPSKIDARTCYNRFYGGHVHVGVPEGQDEEFYHDFRFEMGLTCDLLLGLPDVLFDHSVEARTRRQVYGRIGRHRCQVYGDGSRGYEYRVPSNGWLRHPYKAMFMFQMVQLAPYFVANEDLYHQLVNGINIEELKEAINGTDEVIASRLYSEVMARLTYLSDEGFLPDYVDFGLPFDSPEVSVDDGVTYWNLEL